MFRTVPHPGEFGYETWHPDSYKRNGGANVWGAFSLDVPRGIVFAPTGSPSYDFYGADRPGQNLFGNCVLALDARTGKRIWHYQVVHHDLWDYDLSAQPLLATIPRRGKPVDAVIQVTKHGFVFVLDRLTGKPLFPVRERPVPRSDVPGEQAWPTQPFPTLPAPVSRQRMTVRRSDRVPRSGRAPGAAREVPVGAQRGAVHAAVGAGDHRLPGPQRRAAVGRGGLRPRRPAMFYVSAHDQPSYFKLTRMAPRPRRRHAAWPAGGSCTAPAAPPATAPTGAGVVEVMAPLMPRRRRGPRGRRRCPDLARAGGQAGRRPRSPPRFATARGACRPRPS